MAGGLGGLGRGIARWMASRGARYMIHPSRSGLRSEAGTALIEELSASGVHAEAPACNIIRIDVLSRVIKACSAVMPPSRAACRAPWSQGWAFEAPRSSFIWRMLTCRPRTPYSRIWPSTILLPVPPEVQGSWNLHQVLPAGLDFFILLSSIRIAWISGSQHVLIFQSSQPLGPSHGIRCRF